ncbi:peroxiredoxin family protein [Luteimonas salinilitoris]|uniref:Peroxiredoxin family protein n=1 Tax=Luteimonas salinilitoris TaxID=3237697 RepID=A0ABV4HZG1_9GAMM
MFIAAATCIWLAAGNRNLKGQLAEVRHDLQYAKVGDWLPVTELATLQDSERRIRLAAPAKNFQILYFYSPTCKYCEASSPHVQRLYRQAQNNPRTEMVAVSVADVSTTREHLVKSESEVPTVVLPGERERWVYKLARVPALFVVDDAGRVEFAHYGLISDRDVPSYPTR